MTLTSEEIISFLNTLELGIRSNHSPKAVKEAYKTLAKRYHPDANPESKYKEYRDQIRKCEEEGKRFEGEHVLSPEEAHAKFQQITHAFKMLTDQKYAYAQKNRGKNIDLNIVIPIEISFDEAFFGTKLVFSVVPLEMNEDGAIINRDEIKPEEVFFHVVPGFGTTQGEPVIIRGKGNKCGSKRGNIYLNIRVIPHPVFRMNKDGDVLSTTTLPLHLALKGGKIDVPTMFGIKTIAIPPGTKPGDQIKIKKCGVQERGYQIVEISDVVFPSKEDIKNGTEFSGLDFQWDLEEEDTELNTMLDYFESQIRGRMYGATNSSTSL